MTTSTRDLPIFPAATVRFPAANKIDSNINVVVVLPFVPVTTNQGAGCFGSLKRQASSSSPQIGNWASCAALTIGASGDTPGDKMSRSISVGNCVSLPRRTSAPRISNIVARSFWSSLDAASITITCAPKFTNASAAAKPAIPSPTTQTRTLVQSLVLVNCEISREAIIFTDAPIRRKTMPFQHPHRVLE